jgi:DNA-3-methyladenine glycosylase
MRIYRPLPRRFYEPSASVVAPALLGHWLIRNTPAGHCGGPIVETEAYLVGDPACHGAPGLTARNRVMFGPPGHAYVYFIYGNYFCLNVVCQPQGIAEAVLIRAVEVAVGEDLMRRRRPVHAARDLTNGPGKLCLAMDIERELDGADLCDTASPLFIARNPRLRKFRRQLGPIITCRRVGLTKAADLLLRFYLKGSPFVSLPRRSQVEIRKPRSEGRKKAACRNPNNG